MPIFCSARTLKPIPEALALITATLEDHSAEVDEDKQVKFIDFDWSYLNCADFIHLLEIMQRSPTHGVVPNAQPPGVLQDPSSPVSRGRLARTGDLWGFDMRNLFCGDHFL